VDACVINPCINGGTCQDQGSQSYTCDCTALWRGTNCETPTDRSSLTYGIFFLGIFVGIFVLFAGLIGYMKIKQKTIVDKKSKDRRKDVYMAYMTDTGNNNPVYQDLQHIRPRETDPNPVYHDIRETVDDYITPIPQDTNETETGYCTSIVMTGK
ncbi:sushi, von Willebrand factor type A, EGF and pentraxin domain-containing protein 1-like, partial [Anneissia japonica]|uniref:sushi, von Willebrand factor type A, EGF and pentraxin domain-containing protein 1-like n=1 Tax=Anneissia japonica TaxID=1529436 RepID=UPI0014257EA6